MNVRYDYEYNKAKPTGLTTTDSTHTYTKPGQYFLVQYSEKQSLPMMSCAEVWVYDTLPPKTTLTACGLQVTLTIADPLSAPVNYDTYVINWGDGKIDTVQAGQVQKKHTFTGTNPRPIRVQGLHQYGNCGGTAKELFVPNQPAMIRSVAPSGTGQVRVQIDNPAGLMLNLEERPSSGSFQPRQPVPPGNSVTIEVPVDTGRTTCFRVVPAGTCPGQDPSPERCYTAAREPATTASPGLFFPDAFSPNNDGVNDTFGPIGLLPKGTFTLIIADRWGQVLFSTTDARQHWNGYVDDQPIPAGVYTYQVTIQPVGGQTHRQAGRVLLIR